ncbi:hypothetical protein O7614_26615 [Micromonospora sp. WMMD961]|uniref:hypothetical protein n=1 Tax=Micromonospora sp. WMMD961 TaxID=3016100 RepID=UPI002417F656|nr:hypothetical protein [Micromonospora sp. WMMD961]MDG4783238.1 hypothetical protein [Micromonospora sp. WMMD961]
MTDTYVPSHAAPETPDASRKRRIRTAFQSFVSACAVLMVAVPVALEMLVGKVDAKTYAALVAVAVPIATGARLVTLAMQAAPVKAFIDKYVPWLSDASE